MGNWMGGLVDLSPLIMITVKMTGLLALGGFIHFAFARNNPRRRVLIWRAVTVGVILLLAAEFVLPRFQVPVPEPPSKPDWRKRFEEVYKLTDGEVLRRIKPPFIPERLDYYRNEHAGQAESIPKGPDRFVLLWDGEIGEFGAGFGDDHSLGAILEHVLSLESYQYEVSSEAEARAFPGDWIVRRGATIEEKIDGLERIIAEDFAVPIEFALRTVERRVIVARGRYEFHPEPNASSDSIHIFADDLSGEKYSSKGSGSIPEFLRRLGNRLQKEIIDETEPSADVNVSWHDYPSSRMTLVPEASRPLVIDKVLKNLSRQTSLEFTYEVREVSVWFAAEKNLIPDDPTTTDGRDFNVDYR